MSRSLGDAWVAVKASGQTFGAEVSRIVKAGTAGVKADIPVTVNDLAAKRSFADLKAARDDLARKITNLKVGADDKAAQAALIRLKSRADNIKLTPSIDLKGAARAQAQILGLDAAMDKLSHKIATPAVDVQGAGGGAAKVASAGADAGGLANPGTIAAALAALPFAAQAAGLGIVAALGGALAAIGIAGAARTADIKRSFADLKTHASASLAEISKSFVPVMSSILGTAQTVLGQMTPVFAGALQKISGPVRDFGDSLLLAFDQPAVKTSINAVAVAFGKILTAASPALAGAVANIAAGITKLADAVARNPQAFADFVSDLGKVAGGALTVIASLTKVANWIEKNWNWFRWIVTPEIAAVQEVVAHFDQLRHDIAAHMSEIQSNVIDSWNKTWTQTIGRAIQGGHDIEDAFNNMKQWIWNDFLVPVTGWFDTTLPNSLIRSVNSVRNDFVHPAETAFGNMRQWVYDDFILKIAGFFISTLPNSLIRSVNSVRNDFVNPAKTALTNLKNWIWTDFILKIGDFFTTTLPRDFTTAVSAIGRAWDGIKTTIQKPVKFVIDDVLDGLIRVFDDITNAVGLGKPIPEVHPFGLAQGGRLPGYGGGDRVQAMLEPGEAVVDKVRTARYAGVLGWMGVPGFAAGGIPGGSQAIHTGTTATPTGDPLSSAISKALDAGKIVADLASGNSGAAARAFAALVGSKGSGGLGGTLGAALAAMPGKLINDAVKWLIGQTASLGGGSGGIPGAAVAGSGPAMAIARRLLAAEGWSNQWAAFNDIVMRESGWRVNAENPSGAYGIPQALPGSKMASAGADWRTSAATQLRWMMGYIRDRWHDPNGADANERANHWYRLGGKVMDRGGTLAPGWTPVFNGTGNAETLANVTPGGGGMTAQQAAAMITRLDKLIAVAGAQAQQFGKVLNGTASRGASRAAYGG